MLAGRPLGLSFNGAVYGFVGMVVAALAWFLGQPVFRRLGRVINRIAEHDARTGAARIGRDRPAASEDAGGESR